MYKLLKGLWPCWMWCVTGVGGLIKPTPIPVNSLALWLFSHLVSSSDSAPISCPSACCYTPYLDGHRLILWNCNQIPINSLLKFDLVMESLPTSPTPPQKKTKQKKITGLPEGFAVSHGSSFCEHHPWVLVMYCICLWVISVLVTNSSPIFL